MQATHNTDILIIGGGPAGLSAALYAGRARWKVLVVDQGSPRHAVADGIHNLLTREGLPPAELRRLAWEELASFPTVSHREASVRELRWMDDHWEANCGEGGTVRARAVLLAVGVRDELPDLPGLREKWGHSVHICPFCHGWEMRDLPLATYGHGEMISHFGPVLKRWSDDIVVVQGDTPLPDDVRADLSERGITVHPGRIVALEGPGAELTHVVLDDGTRLARQGLFLRVKQHQLPLVQSLKLDMNDNPHGASLVAVDTMQRTSAPMLWAAGDLATGGQQVVEAMAAGGRAAASMHIVMAMGSA